MGATSHSWRSIQIVGASVGRGDFCQRPIGTGRCYDPRTASRGQEGGVVVMIRHLVRVTLEDVQDIHDIIMGMAMVFNLGLMLGEEFCDLGKFLQLALRVGRKHNSDRQSDGQCKAQD